MNKKREFGKKRLITRVLASLLAAMMLLSSVEAATFATESDTDIQTVDVTTTEQTADENETTDSTAEAQVGSSGETQETTGAVTAAETGSSGSEESNTSEAVLSGTEETTDANSAGAESGSESEEADGTAEEAAAESEETDDESEETGTAGEEAASDEEGAGEEEASELTVTAAETQISVASLTVSAQSTDYTEGLEDYAEQLFGTNGTATVAELTVEQSPEGGNTILSGETITWSISLQTLGNSYFQYSGFNSRDMTMFDEYENVSLTIYAPAGVTITNVFFPRVMILLIQFRRMGHMPL